VLEQDLYWQIFAVRVKYVRRKTNSLPL